MGYQYTNTAKRLPIVFCLDVSPSMGWRIGNNSTSIELLNAAVKTFINQLKENPKACAAAEIAFVTYSTQIVVHKNLFKGKSHKIPNGPVEEIFVNANDLAVPTFDIEEGGGTNTGAAVIKSIELITERRNELIDMGIPFFAPFLVLVTDGNPDKNDEVESERRALAAIKAHCDSSIGAQEIIVPFIIGVGDHIDPDTLNEYAKGFADGYFPIRGNCKKSAMQFNKVFTFIGNSVKKSVHLNGDATAVIKPLVTDFKQVLMDLQDD